MSPHNIMLVGSRHSSERYAGALALRMQAIAPDVQLTGIGGEYMREAGVRLLYDLSDLEGIGLLESLRAARLVRRMVERISSEMNRNQPDVLVQIGPSVFAHQLLELAKARRIPVVYYDTPLNWATHKLSIRDFGDCHMVAGVTRSETEQLQKAGVHAVFVGHPVLDLAPNALPQQACRQSLGFDPRSTVIALMPGSRQVQAKVLLPVMIKAFESLRERMADVEGIIAYSKSMGEELVREWTGALGSDMRVSEDFYACLGAADAAVVTCGAPSLEAALMQTPTIAVHKYPKTGHLLDKGLPHRQHHCMVNVILRQEVIPEIIQTELTPVRLRRELARMLQAESADSSLSEHYPSLLRELGTPGSLERTAALVLEAAEDK